MNWEGYMNSYYGTKIGPDLADVWYTELTSSDNSFRVDGLEQEELKQAIRYSISWYRPGNRRPALREIRMMVMKYRKDHRIEQTADRRQYIQWIKDHLCGCDRHDDMLNALVSPEVYVDGCEGMETTSHDEMVMLRTWAEQELNYDHHQAKLIITKQIQEYRKEKGYDFSTKPHFASAAKPEDVEKIEKKEVCVDQPV